MLGYDCLFVLSFCWTVVYSCILNRLPVGFVNSLFVPVWFVNSLFVPVGFVNSLFVPVGFVNSLFVPVGFVKLPTSFCRVRPSHILLELLEER